MSAVPKDALKGALKGGEQANDDMLLTAAEMEWKLKIHDRLLKVMDLSLIGTVEEDRARSEIGEIVQGLFAEESAPLSLDQRRRIVKAIENEVMGLGPLEPLLQDPTVSDILVNGSARIYVERHGRIGLESDYGLQSDSRQEGALSMPPDLLPGTLLPLSVPPTPRRHDHE